MSANRSNIYIFMNLAPDFGAIFTKKQPIWAPEGSQCSLFLVLKAFLGASWDPFWTLWGPWGALGTALGAVQEPLGTSFLNLGARGSPQ